MKKNKEFKAQQFLKDIGLDMHIAEIQRPKNNVVKLPVDNISIEMAVMRSLDNLSATYGPSEVFDILLKYTHE
jgi:hypothetical protein